MGSEPSGLRHCFGRTSSSRRMPHRPAASRIDTRRLSGDRVVAALTTVALLLPWLTLSCSGGTPSRTAQVTRQQFGDEWPFAVPEATIECRPGDLVLVTVGQRTYGLNGTAMGAGYDSIRYSNIWLDAPGYEPGSGIKIPLSALIRWAVDFCGVE